MAIIPNYGTRSVPGAYFAKPEFPINGACTDFVVQEGIGFSKWFLIDKGNFANGSTVSFVWAGGQVDLDVDSSYNLGDFGNKIMNAFSFAECCKNTVALNEHWEFTRIFDDPYMTVVLIYAREIGAGYNLTITHTDGGVSDFGGTNGLDLILNNNLTVFCDIFKNNKKIGSAKSSLVYNQGNYEYQFYFDLSEFLHRTLSCEKIGYSDYMDHGELFLKATSSIGHYKMAVWQNEMWNGNLVWDFYTVLRGGVSKRDYIRYKKDYFTYYPDSPIWWLRNFVSEYSPLLWSCCKSQKLFSSLFINYNIDNEYNEYDVFIVIYDELGAWGSATVLSAIEFAPQVKLTLNYSYNELGIDDYANGLGLGKVKSYSLFAKNTFTEEEFLLENRTLVRDDYRQLFFVFENSLGGFQTIRTLGEHEYGVEIDKDEFDLNIPILKMVNEDFMASESMGVVFKGEVFSGWLNKEDVMNFLDFLNSENIWIQNDKKEAMVPINILKGSYSIFKKGNTGVAEYGFNFKYIESSIDKHVTDLIAY